MIDVKELMEIFQEKLARSGSLDEAFTKAMWIAYQKGSEEAISTKDEA